MELWKIVLVVILIMVILFVLFMGVGLSGGKGEFCKLDTPSDAVGLTMDFGKVKMTWNNIPGATHYCIYLSSQPDVSPTNFQERVITSTIPYVWEKSEPGTFFFVVTAKRGICPTPNGCEECESPPSRVATAIFNCKVPTAPIISDDSGVVQNTIFVSWFPVQNQDVTEYKLYFKEQNGVPVSPNSFDTKITVQAPTWWFVFQVPQQVTNPVEVVVTACNDCGEGPQSDPFISQI